jgi:hypothetical protein
LAFHLNCPDPDCASQHQLLAAWVIDSWIARSALLPTIAWDDNRRQLHLPISGSPAEDGAYT